MPRILPGETDIYAITDPNFSLGRPLEEVVRALLGAGVRIVQYREKKLKAGAMLEECRLLRRLTREANACFIVDDYVDLAILAEADGVHVGQEDFPVPQVRALVGPDMLIGLSTHKPEQAEAARGLGADYIGVGPIYATHTKEDVVDPVGLEYLDWVSRNIDLPLVAIGGISHDNILELKNCGLDGVAVVSALFAQADVKAAAEELLRLSEEIAR